MSLATSEKNEGGQAVRAIASPARRAAVSQPGGGKQTNWRASLRFKEPPALDKETVSTTGGKDRQLLESAGRGDTERVLQLLAEGANCEWRNNFGQSAVHWASGHGHGECLRVLLQRGARIDAITDKKWTPMHYASYNGPFHPPTYNSRKEFLLLSQELWATTFS